MRNWTLIVSACLQAVDRAQKNTHMTVLSTAAFSDAAGNNTVCQTASNASVSGLLN